jgi:hypothetical protein
MVASASKNKLVNKNVSILPFAHDGKRYGSRTEIFKMIYEKLPDI